MGQATIAGAPCEEGLKRLALLDPTSIAGVARRWLTHEVLDGVNATRRRETGTPRPRAITLAAIVRLRLTTEVAPSGRRAGPTTATCGPRRAHASTSPRLRRLGGAGATEALGPVKVGTTKPGVRGSCALGEPIGAAPSPLQGGGVAPIGGTPAPFAGVNWRKGLPKSFVRVSGRERG